MSGNTFGKVFRLTTFGESHGSALGGVIDGCPPGLVIDESMLQAELDLRKPGTGPASTKRKESDVVHLLSGIFGGKATGTPIGFIIHNEDQRSRDYGDLANIFRPGHADWSYFCKYKGIRDYRGGGRASGRETACRVVGGAIAKALLKAKANIDIYTACTEFAGIAIPESEIEMTGALKRPFFAASDAAPELWLKKIDLARQRGDTLGGIVRMQAINVPPGLGEPVFDRLDATLAHAIMSIGAVKGVEFGAGFESARSSGSRNNDPIFPGKDESGKLTPSFGSNNAGGILGGISTGQDIIVQAAIKPIASIAIEQDTIDKNGNPVKISIGGRHDLAAIPRIIPVISAMGALALADALLLQETIS